MPHVTVHFDSTRVPQPIIDKLKPELQLIVAEHLSYTSADHQDVTVSPNEIYVRQQAAHPTDVNVAIIEIEIQAGRRRERNPDGIVSFMMEAVKKAGIIPEEFFDTPDLCIWLRFCEDNGFIHS